MKQENKMNLIELQNKIHTQNKELGWWDDPRPFSTFVCLFHSELSEAMEGDRKGLMDDHLPKYPMFQVELADFVIRCFDWLGSRNYSHINHIAIAHVSDSEIDCIAFLHDIVSGAYRESRAQNWSSVEINIFAAVHGSFAFAKLKKFDLHKIILEKVEYNKHRADHKRENRAKEGGKKY